MPVSRRLTATATSQPKNAAPRFSPPNAVLLREDGVPGVAVVPLVQGAVPVECRRRDGRRRVLVLVRPNTGVLLRAAADEPRTQQYPVVTDLKRLVNR